MFSKLKSKINQTKVLLKEFNKEKQAKTLEKKLEKASEEKTKKHGILAWMNRRYQKLSLTHQIMAWYTIFLGILVVTLCVIVYQFTHQWETTELKDTLQSITVNAADDIRRFKSYSNGVFFIIYTEEGIIAKGSLPDGFPLESTISPHHITEITINKSTYYYYDAPVHTAAFDGWIRGIAPVRNVNDTVGMRLYSLIILGILFLAIGTFGGQSIIKQGLKPIRRITQTAKDIEKEHNLSRRIDIHSYSKNDEIYELSTTLNKMLDSLENASIREKQFNSDISHELRTPIAVIKAESEFGKKHINSIEEAQEGFDHIYDQSCFLTSLITQLLEIARLDHTQTLDLEVVDLNVLLEEIQHDYTQICASKNIEFTTSLSPNLKVKAQDVSLRRAIGNLLDNAIKFTRNTIHLSANRNGNSIVITVNDNGQGIEPENIHKIWDRLYQTKASRSKKDNQGLGLGLYFVNKVINLHNGQISVSSDYGQSTTFTIQLPYAE